MSGRVWTSDDFADLERVCGVAAATDDVARAAFGKDFGHVARGRCRGVVTPDSVSQTASVVRFACERGLPLTVRGSGMSQSGQSIPADGVSLSTRGLVAVEIPDVSTGTVRCGAGASWRQVVARTRVSGMLPRVLPLNLEISVGGLLSAGGMGSSSHLFGPAVAQITELEVVTGLGEIIRCNWESDSELFEACLGGIGRCGVITEATVLLRPVTARIRTYHLLYEQVAPWLLDQQVITRSRRFEHMESSCSANDIGTRRAGAARVPVTEWMYSLQLSVEFEPESPPDDDRILGDLRPARLICTDDTDPFEFADRYATRFEFMRHSGAWQAAHPWFETFLPFPAVVAELPELLASLPSYLGDGHRLLFLSPSARIPRGFAVPDVNQVVALAILPPAISPKLCEEALQFLGALHRTSQRMGGVRYLSGWIGGNRARFFREHHGAHHGVRLATKLKYHPKRIFRSVFLDSTEERA